MAPLAAAALLAAASGACLTSRVLGLGVQEEPARGTLRSSSIAFAGGNDLYLARGDGSEPRRLIAGSEIGRGGAIFLPMPSPAGERLLFLSILDLDVIDSSGRDLSLNILDLDGRDPSTASITAWRQVGLEKIAPPGPKGGQEIFTAAAAAWSRDGSRIALGLNRPASDGGDAILLLDADGTPSELYELGGRDLSRASSIAWTPGGVSLLFGAESEAGDERTIGVVMLLDLAATGQRAGPARLTELGPGRYPSLSPDGSRIAVVDDRAGQWDLLVLDMRGHEIDRFVRPAGRGLNRPQWSADGRYLYYYSLASTGPLGLVEITMLRCLDTFSRRVFDLARLG
ncbi:MAG TPA: hypothetical protein VGK94_02325 [Candidatus Polarisedimenticolia bacterium]|jgi:Tol biopolymer transport system component